MLIVKIPFTGHGFNMPTPGTLIDPPEPTRSHLLSIGVVERYGTKVDPLPDEVKKKPQPLESSQVAPAQRRRMRDSFGRFVKRS